MSVKKITAIGLAIIILASVFFVVDWMKYTSLNEKVLNQITKNDEVRITIRRQVDTARVSITDKEMVDKILNELSAVELKKENFTETDRDIGGDYRIRIYANGVEKLSMSVFVDENYVWINESKDGEYKIVNQNNLKKIFEDPNFKWAISKDDVD